MRGLESQVHNATPATVLQIAAIAVVLAVLPYRSFSAQEYFLLKEWVVHLAAWTALIALLLRRHAFRIGAIDLAVVAFVVWSLSGAVSATDPWAAATALANTVSLAVVFWTTRHIAGDPELQRRLIAAVILAAGVSAVIGLAEAFGILPRLAKAGLGPGGTLGNRSFLAYFAVLTLPAAMWMANARFNRWHRAGALLVCSMSAAVIVLTRSRASWLAVMAMALVALGVWLFVRLRRIAGLRLAGRQALTGAFLLGGVVVAVVVPNRLTWSAESPYVESLSRLTDFRSGSGLQRLTEYRSTLRMIRETPVLGVGPNNWQVEYPRFAAASDPSFDPGALRATPPIPSSDWLGFGAERGVPGILLLVLLGVLLIRGTIRGDSEHGVFGRQTLLASTLTGLAIVGAVDAVLFTPAAAYVIAVLCGSVVPHHSGRVLTFTPVGRRAAIAIACAGGAVICANSTRRVGAAHLARVQLNVPRLERAVRWDPHHYELRMLLARHWIAREDCQRAVPHATTARSLRPHYPAPERLLSECGETASGTRRISDDATASPSRGRGAHAAWDRRATTP